ncbi:MAG: hypothetical protein HAW66_03160, partial [Shewanella sp.]|nr:hypothetical protein [Shewanella sp.]
NFFINKHHIDQLETEFSNTKIPEEYSEWSHILRNYQGFALFHRFAKDDKRSGACLCRPFFKHKITDLNCKTVKTSVTWPTLLSVIPPHERDKPMYTKKYSPLSLIESTYKAETETEKTLTAVGARLIDKGLQYRKLQIIIELSLDIDYMEIVLTNTDNTIINGQIGLDKPLLWIAISRHRNVRIPIIELLLRHGAKPASYNLRKVLDLKDLNVLRSLIPYFDENVLNPDPYDESEVLPLVSALRLGCIDAFALLLEYGAIAHDRQGWPSEETYQIIRALSITTAVDVFYLITNKMKSVTKSTQHYDEIIFELFSVLLAHAHGGVIRQVFDGFKDEVNFCKLRGDENRTLLHVAVRYDRPVMVRKLMSMGLDITDKSNNERTALHFASTPQMITFTIKNGVEVDAIDLGGHGGTALMLQAKKNNCMAIKTILENGADCFKTSELNSSSALSIAALLSELTSLKIMLSHLSETEKISHSEELIQILHLMTLNENLDFNLSVLTLFPKQVLRESAKYLNEVLCRAVESANVNHVLELLANDFDVNTKIHGFELPLYIAIKGKNRDVVKLLLRAGANVGVKNISGQTPAEYFVNVFIESHPDLRSKFDCFLSEESLLCESQDDALTLIIKRLHTVFHTTDLTTEQRNTLMLLLLEDIHHHEIDGVFKNMFNNVPLLTYIKINFDADVFDRCHQVYCFSQTKSKLNISDGQMIHESPKLSSKVLDTQL